MDVEIVKSELVLVENGTEDQSKVNGPFSGPTKPIMFGSHGPQEVVNGPSSGSTEDHLPKNVVHQWQVHNFYFVRHRTYDDPKLELKFDAAEKDLQNKMQARAQIIGKVQALRSKRTELSSQIGPLSRENERFKSLLDEKKKEMGPVMDSLNELRPNREKGAAPICSSGEDLNKTLMGVGFSDVKKERQAVTAKLKQLLDEKSALEKDIEKLEKELDDATDKRDKAKDDVKDLRKKHDEGNACFYQYRKILDDAKNLTIKKNLAALKDFSNSELEKLMKMWNESKSFREDYEKRNIPSLDIRLLSRDGRVRGPREKPLVVIK